MTETFKITYQFTLPNKQKELFELVFDAQTIELIPQVPEKPPLWTELNYQQCPNCRLTPASHTHCPVAINLVMAIERFDQLMSFDKMLVEVISDKRHVVQKTTAQEGISSLMGLLIAGSSCPVTHFFKPMAKFHLPFANRTETMWRAAATFLLARYFTKGGLQENDMDLSGIITIYNDVAQLNDAMVDRLRYATSKDSTVNALVHLDIFAKYLTPPLEDIMMHIKPYFDPFLVTFEQ
jgi:hypothetical protein